MTRNHPQRHCERGEAERGNLKPPKRTTCHYFLFRTPSIAENTLDSRQHRRYKTRYLAWASLGGFSNMLRRHEYAKATMIYAHILNRGGKGVTSPVDRL